MIAMHSLICASEEEALGKHRQGLTQTVSSRLWVRHLFPWNLGFKNIPRSLTSFLHSRGD